MSKNQKEQKERLNGRISLLFFYTLLMCLVLWGERTARYRYDLIFRKLLPWLLPVAAALCVAGLVWCILAARRTKSRQVISPAFGAYLLVAPILCFCLPMLSYLGKGLELFKLAVEGCFYLMIGYFVAFLLYHKTAKSVGLLAGGAAARIALVVYFYRRQLSPATGILNLPEYGYLSPAAGALITALLILAIAGVLWAFGRVDRFAMPLWSYGVGTGLALLFLLTTVLFPLSFTVRLVLLLILVGLELVHLALCGLLITRKFT